ncbi:hypothetical protein [Helicobacter sp. 10-6591]|uniref:hypothetical protein n=1 Tax=Helicobacter sp. 10-6591 TaxID=2004998 RepID=UPI000DCDF14B|nr:hypothetical protein [Helicobacter sp. 10-6591]RAX52029.1 hypothetical protein CCY97_07885 [Helicobacter sp. 10-6591]
MKFLSWGFFTLTFWTLIFFALVFFTLWLNYEEVSQSVFLIGNPIDTKEDIGKNLEQLISASKLISAKDYFGFYISYYNNFVLILSAIIGLFGISSFFYLKRKNDENMRDIENKTREEVKKFLADKEVEIKKIIKEVAKEYSENNSITEIEAIKNQLDKLTREIEEIKTLGCKDLEIPFKE